MRLDPTILYDDLDCMSEEDEIHALLRKNGIEPENRPRGEPQLTIPSGIENWSFRDIGQIHMIMARWHEYYIHRSKVWRLLVDNRKAIYTDMHTRVCMSRSGTASDRKKFADINPAVRKAHERYLAAKQELSVCESMRASLVENIKAISRLETLLIAEAKISSRESNVSRMTSEQMEDRL